MKRKSGKYLAKPPRRRRRKRYLWLLLIPVIALGLALLPVRKGDPLKGEWLYGSTVYSFDGKGTGSMTLPEEAYVYTYKLEGEALTIDFEDDRLSDTSYTAVIDGELLHLDSAGTSYEMTKLKN